MMKVCQRGQSFWIHTYGNIKKVDICKFYPYSTEVESETELDEIQNKEIEKRYK